MSQVALPHRRYDERPWGAFEQFTQGDISTVKIITVRAGEALSLQRHHMRDEFWKVLSGNGTVTVGEATVTAGPGDEFFIPAGTIHRVQSGETDCTFLEIAFGRFDESDIERLEDKYGRS
jgi:mannose-1-phosphate guanylyltransferase/mannose-1-phosphate guanylyltransferase/mannose-6-phosphate isomerase